MNASAEILAMVENLRRERDRAVSRLDAVTRQRDDLLRQVREAGAALDEAGEPQTDGVDGLSLASRIRNLAEDRDGANTRADDLDAMRAESDRLATALLRDDVELRDSRAALQARLDAGIAEAEAWGAWNEPAQAVARKLRGEVG